ncbi:MAG: terpene cyclase/mutase family protein, partial [Lentisphaerae bacterium]|nr:terpene cyclase/mutase family protein [Lentisphaerota bacterium]
AMGGVQQETAAAGRAAMERGSAWLAAQQQPEGYWSIPDTPALTGLSMWALQQTDPVAYSDSINRALVFLLTSVQEDGSIWRTPAVQRKGGGLANYNTAVCMAALHSLGRRELIPVIQNARTYLSKMQYLGDEVYHGGMGYDADENRAYADLSNSYMAYEAMRLTQDVEDLRQAGDPRADLDWEAAREFLDQIQNLPGVNTNAWVSDNEDDRGGFAYSPGAGASRTNEEGRVTLRSYGSMTYAGLLSLIYAEVDSRDVRVQSAKDWAARHWSLEENPGMGQEGLYYFFNVLAKSLDVMGDDILTRPDGTQVSWREEVIQRLIDLQQPDGSWVNENNRWWEADPNLVTAYTLLTLAAALE